MQKIARFIYGQKSFMRKVEMVYYLKKLNNLFFDNSVIFKAELARMFIDSMCLDVDKNLVVTSVLVYSLKKVNSPQERSRILTEKQRDKEFLQLFSFICMLSYDIYIRKQIIEKIVDTMPKHPEK